MLRKVEFLNLDLKASPRKRRNTVGMRREGLLGWETGYWVCVWGAGLLQLLCLGKLPAIVGEGSKRSARRWVFSSIPTC